MKVMGVFEGTQLWERFLSTRAELYRCKVGWPQIEMRIVMESFVQLTQRVDVSSTRSFLDVFEMALC